VAKTYAERLDIYRREVVEPLERRYEAGYSTPGGQSVTLQDLERVHEREAYLARMAVREATPDGRAYAGFE
jgi:hypothetical protein